MSFLNLKNFWKYVQRDNYLLFALFLGLLLRGLNSTFGSPSLFVSNDEAIAHLSALNMISSRTPISIANYTPLGAYVQIPFLALSYLLAKLFGIVHSVEMFKLFLLTNEGYFLFIPRLISAFLGTVSILVLYKLTYAWFGDKRAALISAFLTAVSFNLVHISHFGRPWSAALFFFLISVYFVQRQKIFFTILSIAASYGFHQAGIFVLPLIILTLGAKKSLKNAPWLLLLIILVAGLSLLTLRVGIVDSIARDQSLIKSDKFLAQLILGKPNLFHSFKLTLFENLSIYYLKNLVVTDFVILIFGLLGLVLAFLEKKGTSVIIFFILSYFLFGSLFFHPLIRYLLPIFVLLIPFSAYAISKFSKSFSLVALVVLLSSFNSIWWNYLFLKTPTFIQADNWINKNVSVDVPIMYTGGRFRSFVPNKNSVKFTSRFNANAYSMLRDVAGDNFQNTRNVFYLAQVPDQKNRFFYYTSSFTPNFIVNYYFSEKESLTRIWPNYFEKVITFNPSMSGEDEVAETLFDASWNFDTSTSRKHPSMYKLDRTGPTVEIIRVKSWNFPQE